MQCLIVISVDVPDPETVVDIITAIDPPSIPYFANDVRIVVGTDVDDTIKFLDEG